MTTLVWSHDPQIPVRKVRLDLRPGAEENVDSFGRVETTEEQQLSPFTVPDLSAWGRNVNSVRKNTDRLGEPHSADVAVLHVRSGMKTGRRSKRRLLHQSPKKFLL